MKKKTIRIISVIMICVVMCSAVLPISANDGMEEETIPNYDELVQPCFENLGSASTAFTVNGGIAYVAVTYYAYSDTFSYATLTIKIQKQFLGIFWTDVNIGADNQWMGYCFDIDGVFHQSFNVQNSGTYRVQLTLKVYGNDGTVDVYETSIKSKAG